MKSFMRTADPPTFDDIKTLWRETGEMPQLHRPDAAALAADQYDGSISVAEWWAQYWAKRAAEAHAGRRLVVAILTACMLTALIATAAMSVWLDRSVATDAGEFLTLGLTDGSRVHVAPRTQLRFEFGDHRRAAGVAHGAAYFEVAHDPARPFTVSSASIDVRAVGTAFTVANLDGEATVAVRSGVVSVSRNHSAMVIRISAGEKATLSDRDGRAVKTTIDITREFAWVGGKLIFDGASDTVGDAVRQFNRLNRIQVVLDDPAVLSRRISGVFRADDPEVLANYLSVALPLTVQREQPDTLRLVPVSPPHDATKRRPGS